ncbi:glycosyltransferase, partial [Escherichia coli]|nr:glycosyltransferase [Escherichia coli]
MREKKINPLSLLIAKTTTELVKEDSIKNGSYTFLNFYSYFIYR